MESFFKKVVVNFRGVPSGRVVYVFFLPNVLKPYLAYLLVWRNVSGVGAALLADELFF